jgi:hypothetical protein
VVRENYRWRTPISPLGDRAIARSVDPRGVHRTRVESYKIMIDVMLTVLDRYSETEFAVPTDALIWQLMFHSCSFYHSMTESRA